MRYAITINISLNNMAKQPWLQDKNILIIQL